MASKYDPETRERVIRLFRERRNEAPEESATASFRRVNELTGIPIDTMRGWVRRAEVDAGARAGVTSSQHEELKRLRRENAELSALTRSSRRLRRFSPPRSSTAN